MSSARRRSTALLFAMLACLVGATVSQASPPAAYGTLPLSFEVNQGQTHSSVEFVARGTGYQLFLAPAEAVLVLRRPGARAADALRMTLSGANAVRPRGVDQLPGTVNYLVGSDTAGWRTSIPTYAKVVARGVYPGVDLVYYGNQRQLEYDFIVAPGADPASIRMAFHGLAAGVDRRAMSLDESGDLALRVPGGDVRLKRPVAYQTDESGHRRSIDVAFAIVAPADAAGGSQVGFQVGAYDRSRPLVIDPVLSYSTYLGGTGEDAGMAIAVRSGPECPDNACAYVTGYTDSLNFPSTAGTQANQTGRDAFVAKLNAAGSGLVYATYLGGNGDDAGMAIAVDSAGQAYVTGYTDSTNFPRVPANSFLGDQGGRDAFVTKLTAAGTGFVYSTYLGGEADDTGLGIAVDSTGNAYVTGWTESIGFPTTSSPYQADQTGRDAFVTALNAAGSALVYSTYLGGAGIDEGHAIAVDGSGNAYVTGSTSSTAFPTTLNGRQKTLLGSQDAFVTKLNPSAAGASSLVYSTYFGGTGVDAGLAIAVDATNLVYVTGSTTSSAPSFIVKFAYQATNGGGQDAFIAKFDPSQAGANASLLHSSFLGGTGDESGLGIALDEEGHALITGFTTSVNFPTLRAPYPSLNGTKDAFVAKFDPAAIGPLSFRYSTYLGGSGEDEGYGVALDAAGSAYVVGLTHSADFPGAAGSLGGPQDAFVAKLSEPDLVVSVLTVPATAGEGGVITITDTTKNTGVAPAGASTTKFYLSPDNKLNTTSDRSLGSRLVPALGPGQEDTATTQLTLPSPLAPATYFLFAQADGDDAVGESFESNNKTRKTIVIGADLTVSALSATSSGLTITVTDQMKNLGGAQAAASTTRFFFVRSTGEEVPLGGRAVGTLAAGTETSPTSTDFSIPPGIPAGSYTVIARADASGAVTETDETNNSRSTPFAVGVDLAVTGLVLTPSVTGAGASISVTPTVVNQGSIAAPASTTQFFLSTTISIDTSAVSLGTQSTPVLAPGGTSAVAASLTIHAATAPGPYFIIAKANAGASPVAETNANNNTRAKSATVGPDLTISFLFPASASAAPGGTVTFKDTTKNTGGGNAAASMTKFYLSTDAVYDAGDVELGQRPVPTLGPGAQDFNTAGLALTVPPTTASGSYYIIARANAGPAPIGETSGTNNTTSAPLQVSVAPDLVVSALTVTLNGTTLTITDTTKNQGVGDAGASTTRFYFSTDATLDEAVDTALGSRDVGPLAVGASSDATSTFSLPQGTAPGTFTIFAKADVNNVVTEGDEGNNRRSRTLDTRGADLRVSALLFSWGTGPNLNVIDTTRNEGPGTAAASTTRFYLSTDAVLGPGDVSLGTRLVGSLGATNQSTATTAVPVPVLTAPGDYFLIVKADDAGVVGELDEGNNTASTPISIRPDLTLSALTVTSAALAGATIPISGTLSNVGPVPAGASVLKLYLSTDATLDAGDTLLKTQTLGAVAAGDSANFSVSVDLPAEMAGQLSIIGRVDADSQVIESNKTNNTRVKSIAVGVDLIISAFSGPATAGAGTSITVSDTTKNQASGTAGASTTKFYLSTVAVFDPPDVPSGVPLGSREVPALTARRTHTVSTSLTIPPTTAAGSYFLIAFADANQVVVEANNKNNSASSPIVIGADLVIAAVSAPATAGSGGTITVADSTTNQGGAQAGASTTRLYLSANITFEPSDTPLGVRVIGALPVGASSAGPTDVVVPPGTPPGVYYVIARADADGAVDEVSEGNNTKASGPILIGPDLVVSILSAPLTGAPGATFNVSDTIANAGGTQANPSVLKFFLSTDGSATGPTLGSRIVPIVPAGGTNSGVTQVTIPANAGTGSFFIVAQVDANQQVTEVDESNNLLASSLKTGPDLVVRVLNAPVSAASGSVITINDQTRNQGSPAAASVITFYLSADAILDPGDATLGSRQVPALAFGAANGGNTIVTLPAGVVGQFLIIAQADSGGTVNEVLEDNNTLTRAISLGPDFTVSSVTAPAEAGSGVSLNVGAVIKNQGADSALSIVEFFLSSDETLSGGDFLLGSRAVPALGPGKSATVSTSVPIPADRPTGQYFIIARVNGDGVAGAVAEADRTNNTRARAIAVGADLLVSVLTVPVSGGAGLPVTITDTTKNDGAGAAPASTTNYYLSLDQSVLDGTDVPIGSRSVPALAAGASSNGSVSVTIPANTATGTWYVIALADGPNVVPETNKANNTRFSKAIKIGPDLVLSTFTGPTSAAAGANIIITDTTVNQGAGNAGTFTVRAYLSADGALDLGDPEVGSRVVTGLAPGASSSAPITVGIPRGISGSFTLILKADADGGADGVVSELLETNNLKMRAFNVTP